MKLMFHKQELYGHWFRGNEDSTGYTDKMPPDAAHEWDEALNDWVPKPVEGLGEASKAGNATE